MLRVAYRAAFAAAVAVTVLLAAAVSAEAAPTPVAFVPCADAPGFGCAQLTVPVDPSGVIAGTVTLSIERQLAVTGNATQAIVALAGGPGQAATPFAADLAASMAPGLTTRDLIVFDQRGTGNSGALSCPAFANPNAALTTTLVSTCATQLGPTRGLYETDDSVADIEAIREALGYSQLVLYGTSYGTKVALRYAEQHPADVAGLVLDSTVPANGPDVFDATTFAAIPGMLTDLCADGACTGITSSPVDDLNTLIARFNNQPAHATLIEDNGHALHFDLSSDDVFEALVAGDLNPPLRSNLPAALQEALHGDYALLAELVAAAESGSSEGIDTELYLATTCEELPFPWNRSDTPTARESDALAAFQAQPAATFTPFTAQTAYDTSDAPQCAGWQFATADPESTTGTLPNVPTLILSGAEDLRTPTANATAVATQIPDATVLVVPNTGHSVLGSDPTSCSDDAVKAFFDGTPIEPCTSTSIPSFLRPVALPPESVAKLHPARGTSGLPGRTVEAVVDTVTQAGDDGFSEILSGTSLSATVKVGGLRAGWASFSIKRLKLHGYSYVPGVKLTGTVPAKGSATGTLIVSGKGGANGTLTYDAKTHQLTGTLGGVYIDTTSKALAIAAKASTARARAARLARAGL
ncbi:MAG: alpha/beta fold hydrolase [Solirubrobacteraceae bacterium]|jgi:pimeloyl-ACP methyl ester carboxylesterase